MKKIFKRTISLILMVSMMLSMVPFSNFRAEASVSAGINDMTALDALGIDISKAPLSYDPNTTDNPFGRETTSIAVVDELFMAGRSGDNLNYSKLYGDNWAVGNSVDSFFNGTPLSLGNAINGSRYVFLSPGYAGYEQDIILGADALTMTEANLDISGSNDGRKDSVAFASYKFYAPNPNEPMGTFCVGLVDPKYREAGGEKLHDTMYRVLESNYNIFGNNEDKSGEHKFKNEYIASTYLKVTSGDYDGDGVDEIAVYVPSADNPRIEIYKVSDDWKPEGTYLDRIMIFQLDKYKAAKAVDGAVPTAAGDTLVPNMVSLVSADFDMDGIDDIAISYGYTGKAMDSAPCKAVMIFGEKAGRFGSRTQNIPLSHNGTAVVRASFAAGDIDGDGEKELVVGGSLAAANFNPNERYVAIYQWDGSSFSVTQSKKFNLFEKDNSGNYVNSNVPDNKTEFYSLPVAPANIAIGHFNGISEPVNIYIDSILIELGDNGMEIVSLLDDNLRSADSDYAEWGARAAQLSGNGTDTLITMTSDIAHSTPPKYNFIEYINAMFGKLSNPVTEKTYMKAIYGSDSGLKTWKNEVKGTAFSLPNTDKDSSAVRYTGEHYYTYIDPEILAVLASPPYFKDLFNGEIGGDTEPSNTSYGTTKGSGTGSSYSNTLSVGLYTSYEKSVSLFGVELFRYEAELEVNNHMTWETLNTSTVEQSVTYETLSGQDTVVFFSMPIETYVYEQTYPVNDENGNFLRTETQSMTVNIPHEASVRNLPLETYERIAADYDELPEISGSVLKHTVGMPSTYPSSVKGYGSSGIFGLPIMVSQGDPAKVGYGSSSQTKEIAMTSSTEDSFNYELDISTKIGAGGGGLMVGITAGYAHGAGTVKISTSGSSYSGTIYALPTAAEAYGYDFNWRLFTYPYEEGNQVFPVVSYIVTDITQPPMVPDNFVQSDEGTTQSEVALTWQHSGNPAGFKIYRYFRAAGSAGFYEVAYVPAGDMDYITDSDGNTRTYRYIDTGLTPNTEYLYRIQTVGNSQPLLSIESETLTAYTKPEGIVPQVNISADELTIYPDTEHTVSVSIANADALEGGTLFFQWQKYDSDVKSWSDLATLNTMSIRFTDAGLDDEGLYRCKVTSRQNTTMVSSYSPVLNVVYSKRTAVMEDLKVTREGNGGILSVKLSGSGTKTIPSGTVVFKLEAEGYSKQYAVAVNNQGIASVAISTVPGVYKVTADYNGNRVFKPNSIDKGADGKGVFYVFGQDISGSYYWDYADSYTYGDSIEFTKYTMDAAGAVISTESIDFSGAINGGKDLWRKMELYVLPELGSGIYEPLSENPLLYEAAEYGGDKPYRPLLCSESGSCTNGVENVLGGYLDMAVDRFESGKAGWVGSYYIPYDLDGDRDVEGYEAAQSAESFTAENPEGFYFTVDKAELKVDFKEEYQDLVKSISEIELYEEKKVILTEDNYSDYGFTASEWNIFTGVSYFRQFDTQRKLLLEGELIPCKYSILTIENECELTFSTLEPNGPGAQLAKNKNALTAKRQLFNDDPLETVAAEKITDTGLFDKGYAVWSFKYSEHGGDRFDDERLFTYPVNYWAFEGHYYETEGYDGNGDIAPTVVGYEESSDRPVDNYYPEHGLNIFRYDRFGSRFPITKLSGPYPHTAGQFTLGIEPTYYLNSYKAGNNYRLAYLRAHIAENYNIEFGKVSMTVTGAAHSVSAEVDDITKGSVELVTPAAGTSKKYPIGTQLIFVATPNEGFEVDYWEVNGVRKQEGGTKLTEIQISGGISVKVYFKAKGNTLSYMADPENAYVDGKAVKNEIICSIPNGKELMAGSQINMSVTAAEGWHFVKWEIHTEGAATQYKEDAALKTTMPDASIRIYGMFERDSYTLSLGSNLVALAENKIIDTSRPIIGDTVITVKPAPGYEIKGEWSVTEGVQDLDDEDGTFTFKLLKDTEISTDIDSGTYKVTISDTTGGEINVSGAGDLEEINGGTVLKFTALPQRGYKVEKWIVNGKTVDNNSETYNCVVDGNMNISVSFIEKANREVAVSVDSGSHAELIYTIDDVDYSEEYTDGKVRLYEGESLTITAIPGTNVMIAGWSTNGKYSQSYADSYTVKYTDIAESVIVFTQSMFKNKIEFFTEYEGSESTAVTPVLTAASDGVNFASGSSVGAGKKLTFTFLGEGVGVSRWTIEYGGGEETDILDEYEIPVTDNVLVIPYTLNDAKIKAYYKLNSEIEELTYAASINPESKIFAEATEGYEEQEEQKFTVENTGTGKIVGVNATLEYGDSFEISTVLTSSSISAGGSAALRVRPKAGLSAGTYTDTLTVTGAKGIKLNAELSFTVKEDIQDNTYTITFNGNGINISPASTPTGINGKLSSLPAPERAGYSFDGWYTKADGGEKITVDTVFTEDTEIYAHWMAIGTEISITGVTITPSTANVAKGASKAFTANVAGTGDYDTTVTWSVQGSVATDTAISASGMLTVAGDETAATLTVTATSNGDPNIEDTAIVTVTDVPVARYMLTVTKGSGSGQYAENTVVAIKADASDKGMIFDKWITSGGGGFADENAETTSFTMPGHDVTVTAIYKDEPIEPQPVTYTVTVKGSYADTTGAGKYEAGENVNVYAGNRSGYTFDGWTSGDVEIIASGSKNASFIMPDKNITVTANWSYSGGGNDGGNGNGGGKKNPATPPAQEVPVEKLPVPPVNVPTFNDVNDNDWFAGSVRWAYENGLMRGITETNFAPHLSATRGMIVTILHRLGGSAETTAGSPFTDTASDYYAEAVNWAVMNNIVSGYGDGRFGPEDSITREQLAVILMNYAKLKGYDVSVTADISQFSDSSSVSDWAADAIAWANAAGLINGKGGGILDPGGEATRVELAAILQRFIEYIAAI